MATARMSNKEAISSLDSLDHRPDLKTEPTCPPSSSLRSFSTRTSYKLLLDVDRKNIDGNALFWV